jgi:hypothetical protein
MHPNTKTILNESLTGLEEISNQYKNFNKSIPFEVDNNNYHDDGSYEQELKDLSAKISYTYYAFMDESQIEKDKLSSKNYILYIRRLSTKNTILKKNLILKVTGGNKFILQGIIIIQPNLQNKLFIRNEKQYWFYFQRQEWISSIKQHIENIGNDSIRLDIYYLNNNENQKQNLFDDKYFLKQLSSPKLFKIKDNNYKEVSWVFKNAIVSFKNSEIVYRTMFGLSNFKKQELISSLIDIPWDEEAFKPFSLKQNIMQLCK